MSPVSPEKQLDRIFASFDGNGQSPALHDLCARLLARQKVVWPQLLDGCRALETTETRTIAVNGFAVQVQYNPQRITSATAQVDPLSIERRPCFLCPGELPAAQQAIRYRREFLILCNPFPIFNPHYTISHARHIPQLLAGALTAFLQLAADLGPQFTVLYNGARCGASAPDHLHFQAVPAGVMPIETFLADGQSSEDASLLGTRGPGWPVLAVEGKDRAGVEVLFRKAMTAMQSVLPQSADEPMMNLCGSYRDNRWRVIIFPRRKHRPDIYYRREEERVLISPGAVDMGGVIVAPRERDFRRLDEGLLRSIFADVSPDEETFNRIMTALSGC